MPLILMNGAPGTGKTTVSQLLHEQLKCPWFEFGWIPEFRHLNPHTEISYAEEEQLSFENLMLVVKNYLRHGYESLILSDLRHEKVMEAANVLHAYFPRIITLYAEEDILRTRVRTRQNGNDYRDEEEAVRINQRILAAPKQPQEFRIDTTSFSPDQLCDRILGPLEP